MIVCFLEINRFGYLAPSYSLYHCYTDSILIFSSKIRVDLVTDTIGMDS